MPGSRPVCVRRGASPKREKLSFPGVTTPLRTFPRLLRCLESRRTSGAVEKRTPEPSRKMATSTRHSRSEAITLSGSGGSDASLSREASAPDMSPSYLLEPEKHDETILLHTEPLRDSQKEAKTEARRDTSGTGHAQEKSTDSRDRGRVLRQRDSVGNGEACPSSKLQTEKNLYPSPNQKKTV